ncbi:MAG: type VI secretion system baseplate subunit TssE [Gammaproteobacteria bacterium]|nr:type VI secretion system baseplate subunit TssE [Gammaproteobacteria bacterium]MCW8987645.1 type VI secretion system baseplate subunit TssE [Gammaproteobacteria bacterium]
MAHIDKKKKLRPSILDRLLDDEPDNLNEIDPGQHQKLRQLRNSVRRDLENLMNARFRVMEPNEEYHELENSLLNYGLPDLATINITDLDKRKEFTSKMEKILKGFEPRFKDVNVSYMENKDNIDRTLRFRIDATLYADPSPEVVVFDSVLEPVTRSISIEEHGHG